MREAGVQAGATKFLSAVAFVVVALSPSVHAHDAHGHHHAVKANAVRSTAAYNVPDVKLVRDDGRAVSLRQEIADGRPVVLNFIFTTCTSICPISSHSFAELQDRLGTAGTSVQLVSISIDPEQDTPERLREYAKRFGAGPAWHHYTGTVAASLAVQRAFNVERGGKMNHAPVTLIRISPQAQWVRIDGFASADQLARELQNVVALR
jgi:protein SCO1/2